MVVMVMMMMQLLKKENFRGSMIMEAKGLVFRGQLLHLIPSMPPACLMVSLNH